MSERPKTTSSVSYKRQISFRVGERTYGELHRAARKADLSLPTYLRVLVVRGLMIGDGWPPSNGRGGPDGIEAEGDAGNGMGVLPREEYQR